MTVCSRKLTISGFHSEFTNSCQGLKCSVIYEPEILVRLIKLYKQGTNSYFNIVDLLLASLLCD